MEYYSIYEITADLQKELIGYVAPSQAALDRLADNAEGIPAISAAAAKRLGGLLAKNRPWTIMKDGAVVGSSFGLSNSKQRFYNKSCIENFSIVKYHAEKLSEITRELGAVDVSHRQP